MPGFYKIDLSRITYREAWRIGGLAYVLLLTWWKLLRTRCYGGTLISDTPGILRLDVEQLPPGQHDLIKEPASELEAADFDLTFYYTVAAAGADQAVAWTGLHRSGRTIAILTSVKHHPRMQVAISLVSRLQSGRLVATGNANLAFDSPPSIVSLRLAGQPHSSVVKKHLERVGHLPVERLSTNDVEGVILESQRLILEHNARRGVYVRA